MRLLFGLAVLLLAMACGSPTNATPTGPASAAREVTPGSEEEGAARSYLPPSGSTDLTTCPAASAHIYHPARLKLLAGCQEVKLSGIIHSSKAEPDGDFHVRLIVDPAVKDPHGGSWINMENQRSQGGALVLEPVCEHTVTQQDAVAACVGYHNSILVPPPYAHVLVTGYWVFDMQHGWQELHPLISLQVSNE